VLANPKHNPGPDNCINAYFQPLDTGFSVIAANKLALETFESLPGMHVA